MHLPFLIESGRLMGKNGEASWKLSAGEGKREWRKTVMFNKAFNKPPSVMVAFSLLDMVCESDYRLSVEYDDVSASQFDVVASTWNDSIVWSCHISWIAYEQNMPDARIETGRVNFNQKSIPGYALHKTIFANNNNSNNNSHYTGGSSSRVATRHIDFESQFDEPPVVLTALAMVDILVEADARILARASDIDERGFDCNLSTWLDSKIWGGSVSWIAVDRKLINNHGRGGRLQLSEYSFTPTHPGFRLHEEVKGDGNSRDLCEHIKFVKNFKVKPTMVAFLNGFNIEVEKDRDLRVNVIPQNITGSGFEMKLGTWKNSKIFQTTGTSIAYGETEYIAPNDDNCAAADDDNVKQSAPSNTFNAKAASGISNFISLPPKVLANASSNDPSPIFSNNNNSSISNSMNNNNSKSNNAKHIIFEQDSDSDDANLRVVKKLKKENSSAMATKIDAESQDLPAKAFVFSDGIDEFPPKKQQQPALQKKPSVQLKKKGASSSSSSTEEVDSCKICFDGEVSTVIDPCGHMAVCFACSQVLQNRDKAKNNCPICFTPVNKFIRIFKT